MQFPIMTPERIALILALLAVGTLILAVVRLRAEIDRQGGADLPAEQVFTDDAEEALRRRKEIFARCSSWCPTP